MSDAADQRVHELLRELERNAAAPPSDLPHNVVRTARWQHAARGTLALSSELAGAVGTAMRLALGTRNP